MLNPRFAVIVKLESIVTDLSVSEKTLRLFWAFKFLLAIKRRKKPTQKICDKKYGFFQTDKDFFKEVASELGLIPNKTGEDIGFERHPLAYLVEAADDICYTIIDFENAWFWN